MTGSGRNVPPATGVVAAILAGGRGSRLGGPKASVELAGRALVSYPLAALRAAELETVVVAKPETPLPELEVPVWLEPAQPAHPLCGIVAGLRRAGGRAVLACGCDMPFVTAPLASWLARRPEPLVVPEVGGRLQPLLARYGPELLAPLELALAEEHALHRVASELGATLVDDEELRQFGDPEQLLFNVNTSADLSRAEEMLRR